MRLWPACCTPARWQPTPSWNGADRGPGVITTEGFRDVLEIGRLRYPRLYDLSWSRPEPLVERRLRLGVRERMDADGSVVRPLDEGSVAEALDVLEQADVEAVAICLLNSYVNGEHEVEVERLVRERLPGAAVSRSSAVLPLIREYDRTSTTVINAYLQPVMGDYLERLAEALQDAGSRTPILMLQSSGGVMPAAEAAQLPAFCWSPDRQPACWRPPSWRVRAGWTGCWPSTWAHDGQGGGGAGRRAGDRAGAGTGRRHQLGDAADAWLGLPAADADHRPGGDWGGRRQHRAGGPGGWAVGGTGQRGRGPGAGLLWARRTGSDV